MQPSLGRGFGVCCTAGAYVSLARFGVMPNQNVRLGVREWRRVRWHPIKVFQIKDDAPMLVAEIMHSTTYRVVMMLDIEFCGGNSLTMLVHFENFV
jgi:hypothetical protein